MTAVRHAFLLLLLLPGTAFADQVFLKDAGSITGRIVSQTATTVVVDVGGGTMGVPMDRVDRIVKGRCALDDYNDRVKKLSPTDIAGWKKLGAWAQQAGLNGQARDAYQRVLKLSPNDPEANEAMGMVQVDGRWMTEEQGYIARGFVQYDGEWMTPAQAQVAQTQDANNQAIRDAQDRASDAEAAAREAERRAEEAEERAEEAEQWSAPTYWGGWGYGGVTAWPAGQPAPTPVFTPASQVPIRTYPR
jgi:hypothetical protein